MLKYKKGGDNVELYTVYTEQRNAMMEKYLSQAGFVSKRSIIYPENNAPIIIEKDGKIHSRRGVWGFGGMSTPVITARLETATVKRYFAESFLERRCVVPASGYFEWFHMGGNNGRKTVYRFSLPNDEIFYMAGFYRYEECDRRYVILTMPANDDVSDIHTRMPVIIPYSMVREYLTDRFNYYDIARRVNPTLYRTPMYQG